MGFLYLLESIRMPVVNEFMLMITKLGEETAFLIIAMIVFWCVDKRRGYYLMTVGFVGIIFNQFLKLMFKVPRPWVIDPDFKILEQAREAAEGYSFPSGHTQMAAGTFGALAYTSKCRKLSVLFVVLAILVGFSRMYVGVHTPLDVLVSAAIAAALVLLLKPMADRWEHDKIMLAITLMALLGLGLIAYVELYPFADVDPHNMESGLKNAYTMTGSLTGLAIVYPAEKKYVNFDTKAVWWAQLLKVVLGLVMVVLLKDWLQAPLEMLLPVYPARAVRYCLIIIAAGLIWPMTFCRFSKLGRNS